MGSFKSLKYLRGNVIDGYFGRVVWSTVVAMVSARSSVFQRASVRIVWRSCGTGGRNWDGADLGDDAAKNIVECLVEVVII
jgi:hypothetical protein